MKTTMLILSILLIASTQAADYWPTTPGATFQYANDEYGSVFLVGDDAMCSGWVDPDWLDIDPAVKLFDLPLEPGGPTFQLIEANGMMDFVTVEVTGPVSVTTPAGAFETMVLDVGTMGGGTRIARMYWLHHDLGPVKIEPGSWELVGWTGVVANDEATWGDVKSMFR